MAAGWVDRADQEAQEGLDTVPELRGQGLVLVVAAGLAGARVRELAVQEDREAVRVQVAAVCGSLVADRADQAAALALGQGRAVDPAADLAVAEEPAGRVLLAAVEVVRGREVPEVAEVLGPVGVAAAGVPEE